MFKNKKKINEALEIAFKYSQYDGEHHKAWAIDRMVRALTGKNYEAWIKTYEGDPEDDSNHYYWDEGTAP
jgi:hypothetical protein